MTNLPTGPFGAILADPPWSFRVWSRDTGIGRSAESHYPTMSFDAIKALPVADIAARDCFLFLWACNPSLPDALDVMRAWGFTYKTVGFAWAKTTRGSNPDWSPRWHVGMGYTTRANVELCLLGTRGKPKRQSAGVRQLIVDPVREHSRKPDLVHDRIEAFCSGPYCELFARQSRMGWTTWGSEATKFDAKEQAA